VKKIQIMDLGPFKTVSLILAALFVIVVCLRTTGYWKSDFDRPVDSQIQANIIEAPQYIALRAELEKVEKGDFVEYEGKWNVVTGVKFISKRSRENGIAVCGNYQALATQIYYNANIDDVQRIGRVVRWNEGSEWITIPPIPPIGHAKWTVVAREFFGR
jgi:hypothetical protein